MARIAFVGSSAVTASVALLAVMPFFPMTGCASRKAILPSPPQVNYSGVETHVLIPPDLNVEPQETVVSSQNLDLLATSSGFDAGQVIFSLPDAIAFALQNNPRIRSVRSAAERAQGQEQVAFAPFLPEVDILGQYGTTSATLAPGIPGPTGFLLANGFGTRSYAETEVALQWIIYDFGRTGGRYRQAVARERIAELQVTRACQTVEFDATSAYLDVLLARASRHVQEDAVRRTKAILEDTVSRREGGVALREDVLRAEVQYSESREAFVLAREAEFNALARLNNAMGRNASLPIEVVDMDTEPPLPGTLSDLLEVAAANRPEIGLAQKTVAAAQEGWQASRGEFLPKIFARGSVGRTDAENVVTGWQEGAGLHLETPLYSGGRHQGALRSAEAEIRQAVADAQSILNAISLQVKLAYHGVVAARERIELAQSAVTQSDENLRLIRVRYHNGNATPTDIVDSEAAVTRSQQRFLSADYTYLAALARLDYAMGQRQVTLLQYVTDKNEVPESRSDELPLPSPLLPMP